MAEFRKTLFLACAIVATFAAATMHRAVIAQKVDKSIPKVERNLVLGEDDVKDLLLLMDTDKNGKISKQEFMRFMEAEFDRLDKDKSGELDITELAQSRIKSSRPRPAIGK